MRMTPQRKRLLADLEAGATFIVTKVNQEHRKDIIEIHGGGRYSDNVVEGLFRELRSENRLAVSDEGLFPGCGQSFKLVR